MTPANTTNSLVKSSAKKVATLKNKVVRKLNSSSRNKLKKIAYLPANRQLVRTQGHHIPSKLVKENTRDVLQRIASETLPDGHSYAKLTVRDWRSLLGRDIEVKVDGATVFGNRVEQPQRGFNLEYRNIVVPTTDLSRFEVTLSKDYQLHFSPGTYSTQQQKAFDSKYGITQKNSLFFNLRGNIKNPKKLIVTFPGFGPSATRVSYAVSFLKWLNEHDLRDAALLSFQDRYGVAGTYMSSSNSGEPLMPLVKDEIRHIADQFGLKDHNILFFGASKGGSIALMAAEDFQNSELVVVVPQLNLPYYFSKPFFVNNLFLNPLLKQITQPGELFLRYLKEDRRIHYLYSSNDELSNYSLVEFARVSQNFTAYRFSCAHGQVAGQGVTLLAHLFRSFLGTSTTATLELRFLKTEHQGPKTYFQAATRSLPHPIPELAMLHFHLPDGEFYQQISKHSDIAQVFHSGELQYVDANLDQTGAPVSLVLFGAQGERAESLATTPNYAVGEGQQWQPKPTMLPQQQNTPFEYPVYDNGVFATFSVDVCVVGQTPDKVVAIIDPTEITEKTTPSFLEDEFQNAVIVHISSNEVSSLASIVARRIAAQYDLPRLDIIINRQDADYDFVLDLVNSDWLDLTVWFPDEIDYEALTHDQVHEFRKAKNSGRLVLTTTA